MTFFTTKGFYLIIKHKNILRGMPSDLKFDKGECFTALFLLQKWMPTLDFGNENSPGDAMIMYNNTYLFYVITELFFENWF